MAVTLSAMLAKWEPLVDSLKGLGSTGNLDAFLRSACIPIAVNGSVVVLEFEHEFHRSKCVDQRYRKLIERQFSEVMGSALEIECVLRGEGALRPDEIRVLVSMKVGQEVRTHTETGMYVAIWSRDAQAWSIITYGPSDEEIPSKTLGDMAWGLIQKIVSRSKK